MCKFGRHWHVALSFMLARNTVLRSGQQGKGEASSGCVLFNPILSAFSPKMPLPGTRRSDTVLLLEVIKIIELSVQSASFFAGVPSR